jgi:putative ABC transport system permease protein
MKLKHTIILAFTGLKANSRRSMLTILGIVIGIMSIIILMSVGQGAQGMILNQIKSMGGATIQVEPGREPKGISAMMEILTDSLKDRDVQLLNNKARFPNIKSVEPEAIVNADVSYGTESTRTMIIGASGNFPRILDIQTGLGTNVTDEDVKEKAKVAVLGANIVDKLFGNADPVGQQIKSKNRISGLSAHSRPKAMCP